MASDLQTSLWALRFGDCFSLVMATAVVYDYTLTFAQEVEYVWKRPWTSLSTLFVVLRYFGLPLAMVYALYGSTFMFGPSDTCIGLFIYAIWGYALFYCITEFVMILRVYAMCICSKLVLGILLAVYIPTVISIMVMDGILYNPNTHLSGGEYEVNGLWACYTYNDLGNAFPMYLYIPRIVLSLLLCILPVIQFVRHSVEMRKALGTWRANRYMKLLAGQCILYFGVNLLANVVEPLGLTLPNNVQVPIAVLCLTLTFVLAPRFIISVRELHSRAQHVDSGFGLGTQRLSLNGEDMAFASVEETVE